MEFGHAHAQSSHPGVLVREECLAPLGLNVTAAAWARGVTRKALSELINGHSGISPEMAIRLFKRSAATPRLGSAS
jgi:antitoxin HigA-1